MPKKIGSRLVYGLGERGSGFKSRSVVGFQDFDRIKKQCLAENLQFEDDEFPPTDASVAVPGMKNIKWIRAADLAPKGKRAKFIIQGAKRFDVRQGELGNCWFLAAVADLTLDQESLAFVVPDDNTFGNGYCGAFHFRFWQSGVWIEVVIDDRLPCNNKGELLFLRSETINEYWSALLEKAYAKLNKSYYALSGGHACEALQAFTGGYIEVFNLSKLSKYGFTEDKLFTQMLRIYQRSSFMGTSVKANPSVTEEILPNGLVKGHAFSITDIRFVKLKDGNFVRLIRMRNPWGTDAEWNGDFCDTSKTWELVSEIERNKIGLTFEADGEFWMSHEDFLENFEFLELCHLNPAIKENFRGDKNSPKWVSNGINGRWTAGVTSGGKYAEENKETFACNPQYVITVEPPEGNDKKTDIEVIISLLKSDNIIDAETQITKIGFKVWALPRGKNTPKPLDTKYLFSNSPVKAYEPPRGTCEYTIEFNFEPGEYVIAPFTLKLGEEGEFLLRVFSEGRNTLKMYDNEIGVQDKVVDIKDDTEMERLKLKESKALFTKLAGEDGEISWWELKMALDKNFHDVFRYEGFAFSEDACRSMVALTDADGSGKLNFFEFWKLWTQVMMWKEIFAKFDRNKSNTLGSLRSPELRDAFFAAGYKVNASTLGSIVRRYGDRNGEIWLDKFVMAAVKLRAMIEVFNRRAVQDSDEDEKTAKMNIDEWLVETLYS